MEQSVETRTDSPGEKKQLNALFAAVRHNDTKRLWCLANGLMRIQLMIRQIRTTPCWWMLEDIHRVCDVCRGVVAENGFTMRVTEAMETLTGQGAELGL